MNIPSDIIYNPIFWIFVSYAIGAWLSVIIVNFSLNKYVLDKHFMSDTWTKRLGILHFGWLIRHSFMRVFNQKIKYKGKLNHEKLVQLKHEMTLAEVGHLIGFYFLLIINLLFIYLKVDWRYVLVFFVLKHYLQFLLSSITTIQ